MLVSRQLAKDLALVGIGITIVSTTSVVTSVDWDRFLIIGAVLLLAVLVPVLMDRLLLRRRAIRFPLRTGEPWTRLEKGYIVAVPFLGWLILPFYFITSEVYRNWPHLADGGEVARFFAGVNFVGTWDELSPAVRRGRLPRDRARPSSGRDPDLPRLSARGPAAPPRRPRRTSSCSSPTPRGPTPPPRGAAPPHAALPHPFGALLHPTQPFPALSRPGHGQVMAQGVPLRHIRRSGTPCATGRPRPGRQCAG
ncbi:hypothetical protein HMPREF3159_00730 [Brachybacterium sp. HMSC06H03]|uniref:hypothetical protein n=1 Tax=Brachybacterium sp. HMSC06H03 TaxID=1581127 RepID=UPI0008D7884D|nr:hypothetical protein [Brachybacterium sp. HMSC06H03]OFT65857.1 hypothetical protein HMPREF3159_00730 [Brachybacterium sp. HMSC06H03]